MTQIRADQPTLSSKLSGADGAEGKALSGDEALAGFDKLLDGNEGGGDGMDGLLEDLLDLMDGDLGLALEEAATEEASIEESGESAESEESGMQEEGDVGEQAVNDDVTLEDTEKKRGDERTQDSDRRSENDRSGDEQVKGRHQGDQQGGQEQHEQEDANEGGDLDADAFEVEVGTDESVAAEKEGDDVSRLDQEDPETRARGGSSDSSDSRRSGRDDDEEGAGEQSQQQGGGSDQEQQGQHEDDEGGGEQSKQQEGGSDQEQGHQEQYEAEVGEDSQFEGDGDGDQIGIDSAELDGMLDNILDSEGGDGGEFEFEGEGGEFDLDAEGDMEVEEHDIDSLSADTESGSDEERRSQMFEYYFEEMMKRVASSVYVSETDSVAGPNVMMTLNDSAFPDTHLKFSMVDGVMEVEIWSSAEMIPDMMAKKEILEKSLMERMEGTPVVVKIREHRGGVDDTE